MYESAKVSGKISITGDFIILKIAYFDCFSGISGDMCLGALVDAGLSFKKLKGELDKIPVQSYRLVIEKVKRGHLAASKVSVLQENAKKGRDASTKKLLIRRWKDIEEIILNSALSQDIKHKGLRVFKRLFDAESKVHGEPFHKVHLHELGAVDCIVDVFGIIIGLDALGIEKVYSSPLNLGKGFIETEDGILPVPAPATAEILKNTPVYSGGVSFELTTPTGAAIIKELSEGFSDIPLMNIEKIGTGAGQKDFKEQPNILRILIGNPILPLFSKRGMRRLSDKAVTVIETDIDDMNPQIFEYVMEKLYKAGALDVYLTHVMMKKARPGVKLTVLCNEEKNDDLMDIILRETSTIGLRFYKAGRRVLQRKIKKTDTEFGKIRVKVSKLGNEIIKVTPEYEDCKRIAKKLNIPLIDVMRKIK